ncbi:DUF2332 family protein [Caulobacter segnis]|uniref:DUF2332 domain-containing protein n=1 Tax=Caulobacter segnis TaxID=88688 RepID=UPI00285F369E|nr:DUF2332 family protein [Caulobacter segnis]MDR6625274.1 hypothetical protein [Caulobacter segnis]
MEKDAKVAVTECREPRRERIRTTPHTPGRREVNDAAAGPRRADEPWARSHVECEWMTKRADVSGGSEFLRQADRCRAMGSPFVASVLEAVDRQLSRAPISAAMIGDWEGDPAAAAIAMRFNGALNALARRGAPAALARLYNGDHNDFDGAIAEALSQEDAFIARWLGHPPQTNEVARAGAIVAALLTARARWNMPFELLDLGSSAGLNLNLSRYFYKLGAISVGDPNSAVRVEPQWRGPSPTIAPLEVVSARGVDLQPLDASNPEHRERLLSFAWADQRDRYRRLDAALRIAAAHPPCVDQGDAATWLAQHLETPQPEGRGRAITHTMFLQYLSDQDRRRIDETIARAGAKASDKRPLLRIGFEWTADRDRVELRMTQWPTGLTSVLAVCHPYGDWLEWQTTH